MSSQRPSRRRKTSTLTTNAGRPRVVWQADASTGSTTRTRYLTLALAAAASVGCGALDEVDPQCDRPGRLTGLDPSALVGKYHGKPGSSLTLNTDMTAAISLPRSLYDPTQHTRTDLIWYGDGLGGCDHNDLTRDAPSPSAT